MSMNGVFSVFDLCCLIEPIANSDYYSFDYNVVQ